MSASGPGYPALGSSIGGAASAGQAGQGQHVPNRRAPSTSSIASSSGTAYSSARGSLAASTGGAKGGGMAAHLETTVTKLLVATKQLLEGLTDWSQGRITEEQVSDIYVRLGNCFNAAVAAFTKEGISMRDLKEVPSLLRVRLEDAINEEASRETLNKHLPRIRPIVLDLLRGLRQKQEQHAAMVAASAHTLDTASTSPTEPVPQYGRRPSGTSIHTPAETVASTSRHTAQTISANRSREDLAVVNNNANGRISPAISVISSNPSSRPSSRNAQGGRQYTDTKTPSEGSYPSRSPYEESTRRSSGSLRRPGSMLKSSSSSSSLRPTHTDTPPPGMALPPVPSQGSSRLEDRAVLPFPVPEHHLQPPRDDLSATPPVIRMSAPPESPEPASMQPTPRPPSMSQPSFFATPPRSSLRPTNSIKKEVNDASLEALKKADPLARRASKRFSAYTFNKISSSTSIAGSPSSTFQTTFPPTPNRSNGIERDSSARDFVNSGGRMEPRTPEPPEEPQRRKPKGKSSPKLRQRDAPEPPVPALPPMSALSKLGLTAEDPRNTPRKKRVSMVTEETEDQLAADGNERPADTSLTSPPTPPSKAEAPASDGEIKRVDRSGSAVSMASSASQYSGHDTETGSGVRRPSVNPGGSTSHQKVVFLQLGRDMKKAILDTTTPPTFAALRMLFTERFAYNPGLSDFPAIYLRDPNSGVQYELEDLEELKDHTVLSLNIEPLDQVKQHIDEGLASLARELKDLKATMSRRMSVAAPAALPPFQTLTHSPSQTLSPSMKGAVGDALVPPAAVDIPPMQRTASTTSVKSPDPNSEVKAAPAAVSTGKVGAQARIREVSTELRNSYDEVQSVRRELGALRQVYLDFRAETTGVLATLKSQTTHVKEIAGSQIAGERAYIDEGKGKLDNRSQDLLTKIEELQDTIDDLKNDVVNRKIKPKPRQMEAIQKSIAAGEAGLDSLGQYIATVKPMWKKTWEAELQNIVDEQQLLNHQEELLADLRADHENVVTVFEQIQQYVTLQNTNKIRKPEFRPPSPEEGHQGLRTVMLEVKGVAPASDKRMKAIEMAEKIRHKETLEKSDEFAQELSGFVEGKMLKKTGGAEEIERIRQMKSEASLRAMFNQTASTTPSSPPPIPPMPAEVANPGLGLSTSMPVELTSTSTPTTSISPAPSVVPPLAPAIKIDTDTALSIASEGAAEHSQASSLEPSPTFSLPEDIDPGETVEWKLS